MRELIQREFADVIVNPHDPQTIYKILQFLDWDDDGEIDFNEFLLLVFRVAKACYWYRSKAPCLLQRTKLTASDKSLQDLEVKNRESHRNQQEEERKTCESNHHPPGEHELQQDTRINELETLEEMGSHHQQRNTQSRNNAKRSTELGEPVLQVYEERSQEPQDRCNSQRRRQPAKLDRQGDVQLQKHSNLQAHHAELEADERQNQERPQPKQLAEVRSHNQIHEPQPLPNQCKSHEPNEPALQAYDQKKHHSQEADRVSYNQPHKAELLTEERSRDHLHEPEQFELEDRSRHRHELQFLDSRCLHQSYIQEPIQIDLRYSKTRELERDISEQRRNKEYQLKKPKRERRIDGQRELELEVYEHFSHQTRDREERGATRDQREARKSRDHETHETEDNGRRAHDSITYERTQESTVVAAEADVKIHRISWEIEPREDGERRVCLRDHHEPVDERRICQERQREEPERERRIDHQPELELDVYEPHSHQTREREDRGATSDQKDAPKRCDHQKYEPEDNGRRPHELAQYERKRESAVVAAEAGVKFKELEPRENLERRDHPCERQEPENERSICPERERDDPKQKRRIKHQQHMVVF
ncbi:hypothetical protein AV530_008491 [Patagioenas fasciata monilis]|nr:hypothetical protein AV530_008491 [Patagioenas fasciata monilis]